MPGNTEMWIHCYRQVGIFFLTGIAMLASGPVFAAEADTPGYYFEKEPYIHPKIIEDLTSWISDSGEQVVAVNLLESMGTNRYYGDIKVREKASPLIYYENTEGCKQTDCTTGYPVFGYRLIGRSSTGIYVLFTESRGGGTGSFRNLFFASLEKDKGLSYDEENHTMRIDRERWIIKKLGEIPLGDRYEGELSVKGDVLHIGKNKYSHSAELFNVDTEINIESLR